MQGKFNNCGKLVSLCKLEAKKTLCYQVPLWLSFKPSANMESTSRLEHNFERQKIPWDYLPLVQSTMFYTMRISIDTFYSVMSWPVVHGCA